MIFERVIREIAFLVVMYGVQVRFILDHPMPHGGILLVVGVLSAGVISLNAGPLFAVFYFLVLVGGVLIVFAYTISLVPYDVGEMLEEKDYKKLGLESSSTSHALRFLRVILIVAFRCLALVRYRWGPYSYTWLAFYRIDWAIGVVMIGVILLLLIISAVGIARRYKGALVLRKVKEKEKPAKEDLF